MLLILGGTPAQLKTVISTWLDSIITAVARTEPRVFNNWKQAAWIIPEPERR